MEINYSIMHEVDSESEILPIPEQKGLSVLACALFIVATMAGSGILAIPKAIGESSWTGVGVLVGCCCLSLYCGIVLGECWILARKANPQLNEKLRDPYPAIGQQAVGKWGRRLVEFCVLITLFGVCVVFLLLASQQIASLINTSIGSLTPKNEFRIFILICGFALLPFTWLGSPKEIWQFALGASLCTIIASVMIVARTSMYLYNHGMADEETRKPATVQSFFTAFGTMAFSFGGATTFPTFQTDMKYPNKFVYSAIAGFTCVLIMYLPVVLLPYLAFGSNLDDNILITLKNTPGNGIYLITTAEALITFHLLFTFIITVNPIGLQIEKYIRIEHAFGYKRMIIRSLVTLLIIAIAEAIPNFGPILSFVGGSTITMAAFVMPCWFYLRLKKSVPLYIKVLHFEIIFIALISGGTATYTACTHFTNPFTS